ncbi:MAG: hypothetical protein IJT20_03985 [Synergistaceae bacterium]|nr:hypothetical protein [Synergistaceae bacterium]
MENLYGEKVKNKILSRLFTKAEIAWGLSDTSESIGPMIDLIFISQFIGPDGVTVMGYVAPLIMLISLIGNSISNGARIKTAPFLGSGNLVETNRIFSNAAIWGGNITFNGYFDCDILRQCLFCAGSKRPEYFCNDPPIHLRLYYRFAVFDADKDSFAVSGT